MMTLSTINGDAGYYGGAENYEIIHDDQGKWFGNGAETLGLRGDIAPATLDAILRGHLPDGSRLTRLKDGAESNRPGIDLTFGAPKSVSILGLMGGDTRLVDAFRESVTETLTQLEKSVNTRVTENGEVSLKETNSALMALFTHDINRNGEMHLHTHALLLNATHDGEKWRALGSDIHNRNGIREQVYDLQVAWGQMQREILRPKIEALGYTTVNTGKNGLFEIAEVPGDVLALYSSRHAEIDAAVGPGASARSRQLAALKTREQKTFVDGETRQSEWWKTLEGHDFDPKQVVATAREATQSGPVVDSGAGGQVTADPEARQQEVQSVITQTIAALSDKAVQFSHAQVMSTAAKMLPPAQDTLVLLRAGIAQAIDAGQLIPMDKEKGVFTSHIHLLDELSVKQLAAEHLAGGKVLAEGAAEAGEKGIYRTIAASRAPVLIAEGKGGAAVQGERIAHLAGLSEQQGRSPLVVAPTAKFRQYLQDSAGLSAPVTGRAALRGEMGLTAHSTVIVPQAETLGVKDTLFLIEQARTAGAQLIFMDSGMGKGNGHAPGTLEAAGVTRHRFADKARPSVQVVSESDKNQRYRRIAEDSVAGRLSGENIRVQVSGAKEQSLLTGAVREVMREQGLLTGVTHQVSTLTPVYLTRHDRMNRDTYRTGMVLERFNAEEKRMERYTIDRVSETKNTLRIVDGEGNRQALALKDVGEQWSLYRPGQLEVATGDTLRVLGREARGRLKAGNTVTVAGADDKGRLLLSLSPSGDAGPERAGKGPVAVDITQPLKLAHGYVESPGATVQDDARVLAALTTRELREETVNRLANSGKDITLYSAMDRDRAEVRLSKMTGVSLVSDQVKGVTGKDDVSEAAGAAKDQAMTDAQRAVYIALNDVQNQKMAFQSAEILTAAIKVNPHVPPVALQKEITRQLNAGDLMRVEGQGGLVVPRVMYEMEKSILRDIAEGKNAVEPLMATTPDAVLTGLTEGQQGATRLILESRDRFTGVQGYAGVGKTTQFKAVVSAINTLPESQRPDIFGLAPTHRAVGEMQSVGVRAQTLDSFLFEHQAQLRNGETPDYSNRVFLVDEASMAGNRKLSETYRAVVQGGGRAVTSGDDAQLKAIETGQPFRLAQQRSAMDVAIMKEIVRQNPELRAAVYDMIMGDVRASLEKTAKTLPDYVPRHGDAYIPASSVTEVAPKNDEERRALAAAGEPVTVIEAIARDFSGRTANARDNTIVVAHLNRDRRDINSAIHDQLLAKEAIVNPKTVTVLEPVRVTDSQARTLNAWMENTGNTVMLNRDYWTITGSDPKAGVAMLKGADGREMVVSPFDNSTQKPQFYREREMEIAEGDRMRFTRTDTERGYINNERMTVEKIDGDRVVLSGVEGGLRRELNLSRPEDRHLDLGYAVTAYGAQAASERFAITLEGVTEGRKVMATPEAAYVGQSRHKEHVQVYTDGLEGWLAAVESHRDAPTAHDILHERDDRQTRRAEAIMAISRPADSVAYGRHLLESLSLDGEKTSGRFIPGTSRFPDAAMAFPAWNEHGHRTGIMMLPLDGRGDTHGAPVITGAEDARFVAIQQSSNGEVMMADSLSDAFRLASAHPDTGVVLRFSGEGEPHNIGKLTGGDKPVIPELPELAATLAGAGKPSEEELKAAAQQHQDEQKPDRVLPADALPELVKRVDDILPDADKQPDAQTTATALEKLNRDARDMTPVPEAGATAKTTTTELRNIEREIIKSFED